mmetsp:Transcript_24139/g.59244  ORF Transcript_24139/g.59244 Transcript_24139/m.59244 type:complete len:282 (-) Transcript_24139:930-1775(-)
MRPGILLLTTPRCSSSRSSRAAAVLLCAAAAAGVEEDAHELPHVLRRIVVGQTPEERLHGTLLGNFVEAVGTETLKRRDDRQADVRARVRSLGVRHYLVEAVGSRGVQVVVGLVEVVEEAADEPGGEERGDGGCRGEGEQGGEYPEAEVPALVGARHEQALLHLHVPERLQSARHERAVRRLADEHVPHGVDLRVCVGRLHQGIADLGQVRAGEHLGPAARLQLRLLLRGASSRLAALLAAARLLVVGGGGALLALFGVVRGGQRTACAPHGRRECGPQVQ